MRSHHVVFTYNETDYEKLEELFSFKSTTHFVDTYGVMYSRDFQMGVLIGSWMKTPEVKLFFREDVGQPELVLSDVQYIESSDHVINIYTDYRNGKKTEMWGSLAELEESLKWFGFVRVHRSYLVPGTQFRFIRSEGGKHTLVLQCGAKLPIGRIYWQKMNGSPIKRLMNFFRLKGYHAKARGAAEHQS